MFNMFRLDPFDILQASKHDDYYLNTHMHKGSFSKLFSEFDHHQITRAVPVMFKHTYSDTDFRIYQYDEIQRKIIYGVMRRAYALQSEVII